MMKNEEDDIFHMLMPNSNEITCKMQNNAEYLEDDIWRFWSSTAINIHILSAIISERIILWRMQAYFLDSSAYRGTLSWSPPKSF